MSLKALLEEKRGTSFRCVEKHYGHAPLAMIRLCPWQKTEWMLRWSGLNSLSFAQEEGKERLDFHFAQCNVTVIGISLREILEDIQTSQLSCLRSFPVAYRASFPGTEPFIEQLIVQPKAGSEASPSAR